MGDDSAYIYVKFKESVELEADKTYFIDQNGNIEEVKYWKHGFPVFR